MDVDGRPRECDPRMEMSCPELTHYCHVGKCEKNKRNVCISPGGEIGTTVCCKRTSNSRNPCNARELTGVGNYTLRRYAFDSNTRQCEEFTYRGTKGNEVKVK